MRGFETAPPDLRWPRMLTAGTRCPRHGRARAVIRRAGTGSRAASGAPAVAKISCDSREYSLRWSRNGTRRKGVRVGAHSTQHMLLTADDTSSCIHAAAVRAMIDGIEIKCSFLSFFSLLASWPAAQRAPPLSTPGQRRRAPFVDAAALAGAHRLINPLLPSDDQLLPLHAQQHAGQLPRARCRTRSRARPCEHRKGASGGAPR